MRLRDLPARSSPIPSQRTGSALARMIVDFLQITSLPNDKDATEVGAEEEKESALIDQAIEGNKTAQERLVDYYDDLAGRAIDRARSATNPHDSERYSRLWLFYSKLAQVVDSAPNIVEAKRSLEAVRESTDRIVERTEPLTRHSLDGYGPVMYAAALALGVFLVGIGVSVKGAEAVFAVGIIMTLFFGYGFARVVKGVKGGETKSFRCGNCDKRVSPSDSRCQHCGTKFVK